jgi:hypothetical protein
MRELSRRVQNLPETEVLSTYESTYEQRHDRRRYDRHQPRAEARRASAIERARIDGAGLEFADQ